MSIEHAQVFVKTLSANDVGATGSHQAGILIPKQDSLLAFFPSLPAESSNPRATVEFLDIPSGKAWEFEFIYYNGKLFGTSSRNEYRLSGMTSFLRTHRVSVGDKLELSKSVGGHRYISHHPAALEEQEQADDVDSDTIVLSGTWKVRRARSN